MYAKTKVWASNAETILRERANKDFLDYYTTNYQDIKEVYMMGWLG